MASLMVFMAPIVVEQYDAMQLSVPLRLECTITAARFIQKIAFIGLGLALFGVALFEWSCHAAHKGALRLAFGAGLALVLTVAAFVETASVGIAMVQAHRCSQFGQSALIHVDPALPLPDAAQDNGQSLLAATRC